MLQFQEFYTFWFYKNFYHFLIIEIKQLKIIDPKNDLSFWILFFYANHFNPEIFSVMRFFENIYG